MRLRWSAAIDAVRQDERQAESFASRNWLYCMSVVRMWLVSQSIMKSRSCTVKRFSSSFVIPEEFENGAVDFFAVRCGVRRGRGS